MKFPSATPSWGLVACATLAAVAVCFPLGIVVELIWAHPLVSFGAFLILALVSLRLHGPHKRVLGVAVDAVRLTVS